MSTLRVQRGTQDDWWGGDAVDYSSMEDWLGLCIGLLAEA